MIDITGLREDKRPQSSTIVHALLDRLEAAEADALEQARLNGMGSEREAALMTKLESAEKERDECNRRRLEAADHFSAQTALMKKKYDALRAKIARMEQQEPVATAIKKGADRYWMSERMSSLPDGTHPLYALPGAQPAQSVPDISDDMIEDIESRAEQSYRRRHSGIHGQQITPADALSWHIIHAEVPHEKTVHMASQGWRYGCHSARTGDDKPRGGKTRYLAHPWSGFGGRPIVTNWLPRSCCHSERATDAACEGCVNRA